MKVKLLKKVRKRYSIIRVDKVTRSSNENFNIFKEDWGLPFYYVKDNYDSWTCWDYSKTKKEALANLSKLITKDYRDKFIKKEKTTSKVWWNN